MQLFLPHRNSQYQTTISQIEIFTKGIKNKWVLDIFLFNVKIIMIKNQICLTKNSALLFIVIFGDHLVIFTTSSRKGECWCFNSVFFIIFYGRLQHLIYTVNKECRSNMPSVFVLSIDTIHERACNGMRFRNSRGNLHSLHLNMQLHGRIQIRQGKKWIQKPCIFPYFQRQCFKITWTVMCIGGHINTDFSCHQRIYKRKKTTDFKDLDMATRQKKTKPKETTKKHTNKQKPLNLPENPNLLKLPKPPQKLQLYLFLDTFVSEIHSVL